MSKFEGLFLAHEFRTYNLEYIQIVKQGVKTVELWEDGVSSIFKNRQREDKIYFRCKKVKKVCTVYIKVYIHIQYRVRTSNCRDCLDRHICPCNGRTGPGKVSLEPHDSKEYFDISQAEIGHS